MFSVPSPASMDGDAEGLEWRVKGEGKGRKGDGEGRKVEGENGSNGDGAGRKDGGRGGTGEGEEREAGGRSEKGNPCTPAQYAIINVDVLVVFTLLALTDFAILGRLWNKSFQTNLIGI